MDTNRKAVILLSGGVDSTTAMAFAKQEGYEIYGLSFRYGQLHTLELEAAQRVAKALGAKEHLMIDIDLAKVGGSALTDQPGHVCSSAKHDLSFLGTGLGRGSRGIGHLYRRECS
jgi:7-cyano-7-deazaguanine synthase in queuosine biosynthesis